MIRLFGSTASIRVTFLRWGVLILGIVHLWQVLLLGRQLETLRLFTQTIPPELRLILAAFWSITWLLLGGLSRWRLDLFDRLIAPAAAFYLGYQLVMIWLSESSVAQAGWPVTVVWGGALLLLAAWPRLRPIKPNRKPL